MTEEQTQAVRDECRKHDRPETEAVISHDLVTSDITFMVNEQDELITVDGQGREVKREAV